MDISNLTKGLPGQFYDTSKRTCLSFLAEDVIPMGTPVMRGTNLDTQVKRFNGGVSTNMVGIAGYSALQTTGDYSSTQPQGNYPIKSTVTVVKDGRIWVPLQGSQTVLVNDTAYIDTLFDRITNVFVEFQTFPIGRFLTSGVSATGNPILFALELIEGFEEDQGLAFVQKNSDKELSNTSEENFNKKLKREKK